MHSSSPTIRVGAIVDALERAGLLVERRGRLPDEASAITDDSRAVTRGALFVAVRGSQRDGHDFLESASERGASLAIVEDAARTALPSIVVREGRRAAAIAAAAAYGDPAARLQLVAVTGTNGKTTTVGILRHLLDRANGGRSASIGTLGVLLGGEGEMVPGGSGLTTPGPIELQRTLARLYDLGVRSVAMEVSSHSLDQRRIEGVRFDAGVFTNLTRDHLDYHGTMEAYFAAKARLLDAIDPRGAAVVNADDDAWRALPSFARTVRFSAAGNAADVEARDVEFTARGSTWTLRVPDGKARVSLPLMGDFNVANAVGAAAAAWSLGMPVAEIAERLTSAPQVPGRLEILHERPTVLRDYSHTPDSLERALDALRPFAPKRLILVFGCGGDRDRGKRPIMGEIAERKADHVILTSDNPRTEDPERILDDIEAGMARRDHERIESRHEAIERALAIAGEDDVVLLAGKGHETYQIRGTVSHPFDERSIVHELTAAGR